MHVLYVTLLCLLKIDSIVVRQKQNTTRPLQKASCCSSHGYISVNRYVVLSIVAFLSSSVLQAKSSSFHRRPKQEIYQWYSNEPRGGFEQVVEKLPQGDDQQPDNNASWTTVHEKEEEEVVDYAGARNAKSYFVFVGLAFSLVSMLSCNFANVHWAVDGNSSEYESTLTHIGLFRWYNPKTSSCWAYTQDDTGFFFVDRAARGLSAASVGFGGCAAFIVAAMTIANLACCAKKGCCYRFNLNSTSLSTTFFALSGLVFTSSILQNPILWQCVMSNRIQIVRWG